MLLKFYQTLKARQKSDALVLPFFKKNNDLELASTESLVSESVDLVLKSGDFKGDLSETALAYESTGKEARVILLGLGQLEEISVESIRKTYSSLVKECLNRKLKNISIVLPHIEKISEEVLLEGVAEGIFLTHYQYGFKESKKLNSLNVIGKSKKVQSLFAEKELIAEGVYLCRDLVNKNADEVTPQYLGHVAKTIAKKYPKVTATVFNKKRIEQEKMGLLLAVNQGSSREPSFIILKYSGAARSKDHTVLVGKGVTYDTGGLNLKPTGSMETMRCDMAGAATVLGIIQAVAALELKVNVTAVIPATENGIDAASYKPGDVYTSYSGKTVEIGNTDAEGRLILADALSYALAHLKPSRMIDFATLTGAMVIALGSVATGMMTNNKELSEKLAVAGERTYERVWRFPLYEEYKKQLKSDIADIKNTGGRAAGSITAALFLEEFVGKIPWAHLDIAGTAFIEKEDGYLPKYATGVCVRLIVDFLKNL